MLRLFSALIGKFRRDTEAELPIREELYSIERLEQFAVALAAEHKIAERPQRVSLLLPRLEENGRKLIAAYKALAESIRDEHVISPAAEWLVDNFHIVEEQVREIREDLPKSYYHELPKLAEGPFKNYPRIYAFCFALIAHTDSHLDTETLRRFINAYQKVSPLSIGELWAVPINLRIALVENLRRLASRTRRNICLDMLQRAASETKRTEWPTNCSNSRSANRMSWCLCLFHALASADR